MVPLRLYSGPAQNNLENNLTSKDYVQCHALEAFGTGEKDTEHLVKGSTSVLAMGSRKAHFPFKKKKSSCLTEFGKGRDM